MASPNPSSGRGLAGLVAAPWLPVWHSNFGSAPSLTLASDWERVPLVFLKINDTQSYKIYLSKPMFVYLWQLAPICSGGEGIGPSFFGSIDFWKERVFKGPGSRGRRADKWIRLGVSGGVGAPVHQASGEESKLSCLFSALASLFSPFCLFKPFLVLTQSSHQTSKETAEEAGGILDLGLVPK